MTQQFDLVQKFGKNGFDTLLKAFGVTSSGTQAIVAETASYATKSFKQGIATFEKLAGAKTLGDAIEIQTDYLKSAHECFVAQSKKMSELSAPLAKDALAFFNPTRPVGITAPAKAATSVK